MVDYLIMEAVSTKVAQEDTEVRKQQEVKNWKKDKSELEQFR